LINRNAVLGFMRFAVARVGRAGVEEAHEVITRCSDHLKENFDLGEYWDPPYPLGLLRRDTEEREVYAARLEDNMVATFTLDTEPPAYFDLDDYMAKWENPEAEAIYVFRLAVLPQLQGRGIGTWCMEWIERDQEKRLPLHTA